MVLLLPPACSACPETAAVHGLTLLLLLLHVCLSDLWVLELNEGKALAHAVRALGHEDAACGCRTMGAA